MKFLKHIQILVLVLFPACSVCMEQSARDMSKFEDFARRAMAAYHVPGASIAIVKDGKIAYAKGFGFRDVEHNLPVSPETIFAIGSCTKAFTATAVGILVDQGKLDWDTPIKKYLPDFAMYDQVATENLSLRDCLCHRAGLPCYDCLWNRFRSRAELVANLRYLKPNAKFREKYQYNNFMYVLAGYVLETVLGMPWDVFIRENITKPLGMQNTYFSSSVVQTHPNAALAYEFDKSKHTFKHVDYLNIDLIAPAGAIYSSAVDMAQWVIMNLRGRGINAEVHKPQIIMEEGEDIPYCLGWFKLSHEGDEIFMHRGGIVGCSSSVAFMPKKQIGFVVLSNIEDSENGFVTLLTRYAYACATNNQTEIQECEKSLLRSPESKPSTEKQSLRDITPEQAAQFIGTYHNDLFGDLVINFNGSMLTGKYVDEMLKLERIDENTFKDAEGWMFRFKRNGSEVSTLFELKLAEGCLYEFIKV